MPGEHNLKAAARRIFQRTLAAIDIHTAIARLLDRDGPRIRTGARGRIDEIDLRDFREIVVIALGKASIAMAEAFQAVLAPDFTIEGILVSPHAPARALPGWKNFVGGAPAADGGKFCGGTRDFRAAGTLRRALPGSVPDFRRRIFASGSAAGRRNRPRGFQSTSFVPGDMWRAD
jgi:glycerate-2-kinase